MSLVVGLVHCGQIYMGADSTEAQAPLALGRRAPIYRCGPLLLGFPTTSHLSTYLLRNLTVLQSPTATQVEEFVRLELVSLIRQHPKDRPPAPKPATPPTIHELRPPLDPAEQDAQPVSVSLSQPVASPLKLLVVGGLRRLFTVWSDERVVESLDGYDAAGVGADAALGALYATSGLSPEARIERALIAAERLTGTVRRPFHVLTLEPVDDSARLESAGDQATDTGHDHSVGEIGE